MFVAWGWIVAYVQSVGFGNDDLLDMAPSDESIFTMLVESEG